MAMSTTTRKESFNIWTRTLWKCFNISSKGKINVNLGAWYHKRITQTNEWLAYHCVTKCSFIITETPGQYREYTPTKSRSNSSTISSNSSYIPLNDIPSNYTPADKYINSDYVTVKTGRRNGSSSIAQETKPGTGNNKQDWLSTIIQNCNILNEERARALINHPTDPIIISSDGGTHNYQGTLGLVISDGTTPLNINFGKLYSPVFYESSF
jgi:hypothetical protein